MGETEQNADRDCDTLSHVSDIRSADASFEALKGDDCSSTASIPSREGTLSPILSIETPSHTASSSDSGVQVFMKDNGEYMERDSVNDYSRRRVSRDPSICTIDEEQDLDKSVALIQFLHERLESRGSEMVSLMQSMNDAEMCEYYRQANNLNSMLTRLTLAHSMPRAKTPTPENFKAAEPKNEEIVDF